MMNSLDWIIQMIGFSVLAAVGVMTATQPAPVSFETPAFFNDDTEVTRVSNDTEVLAIPCVTPDGKNGVLHIVDMNADTPQVVCRAF